MPHAPQQISVQILCAKLKNVAIPVGQSSRLLAQRYNSESSLLVGLLTEQGEATIAAAAGLKQSYHESGESAPSKRPRKQPLDSHFVDSLMLSVAGEHQCHRPPSQNFHRSPGYRSHPTCYHVHCLDMY